MLSRLARRRLASPPSISAGYDPAHPLCLMHVPKASGTSLAVSLAAALSPARVVGGFDRVLFGDFAGYDTFSPAEQERIFHAPSALPTQASLVAGHFSYATLRAAYPAGQLITVLREPFTRLMSLWMFWRRHTDTHLAGLGEWATAVRLARLPLADFLDRPQIAAQTDNVALRMLLWPHPLVPLSAFIDPAHDRQLFKAARARLAEFAYVGLAEAPDFWRSVAAWLGRPLVPEHRNESAPVPPALQTPFASQLDSTCLSRLQSRSRLDLQLWEDVVAAQRLPCQRLLQQTLVQHAARYGALMATSR